MKSHLFLIISLCVCTFGHYLAGSKADDAAVDRLERMLFPHRNSSHTHHGRHLAIQKAPVGADVPCTMCQNMAVCTALNNLRVEETYYPDNTELKETCKVIDSFGKRIKSKIFGNGRTFRDTPQCQEIVMQYLCLFYGSDSAQYKNYCVLQENVTDPNPLNHLLSARPPCRSFCVQIAQICALDPTFIQTCNRIACPPTEAQCTPDPKIDNQVLGMNLGCDVPYYRTPYNGAHTTCSMRFSAIIGIVLIGALYLLNA